MLRLVTQILVLNLYLGNQAIERQTEIVQFVRPVNRPSNAGVVFQALAVSQVRKNVEAIQYSVVHNPIDGAKRNQHEQQSIDSEDQVGRCSLSSEIC